MYKVTNQLKNILLGVILFQDVHISSENSELWININDLLSDLKKEYSIEDINMIERIKEVRQMFKDNGIDPLRYRPSSEALMRRVLKGQELYKINSLVDTNNYCSLEFLLPIGVYNADQIIGENLNVRLGITDESYRGIGKDVLDAEGKIILKDEKKICGGPISDSVDTMVTTDAKNILMVIYSPFGVGKKELSIILDICSERINKYNQGKEVFRDII